LPTVADHSTPQEALDILAKYAGRSAISAAVFSTLERLRDEVREIVPLPRPIANLLIGNNATAVNSAIAEAKRLGYDVFPISSAGSDGLAEDLGRTLARYATLPQKTSWPKDICYVSGGECTVRLAPTDIRGLGGRNQQTVLAALVELQQRGSKNFVVLSGGTDGEDGPTDAAGAFVDTQVVDDAKQRNLDAAEHLRCNDAYHFFERLDALIKTGPTHTNVCDLRIVLVKRQ
jgi:glycerate-2-kinase